MGLNYIKTHRTFQMLREKKLLKIKRLNYPITTAFVARDIEFETSEKGQIQCLFYQFATDSPDCPIYVIESGEPMYSDFQNIILNMWNSADEKLEVPYIKSN